MTIVPFHVEHLARLRLQPHQAALGPVVAEPDYGKRLAEAGPCYSAVQGDDVLATAGFFPQWEGRCIVWALLSADCGRHLLAIHRAVERAFTLHPFRRYETCVVGDFDPAHRWATMLGFQREGLMRAYLPDGTDAWLYARVS